MTKNPEGLPLKTISIILVGLLISTSALRAQPTLTNAPVRFMAANLTSGNNQRYETPGLNILQALGPDIVAIQEFNVSNSFGINTPAALSNMVATTFGPGFVYFRETNSYSIPNGIISRYPMLAAGQWIDSDTGVNDRGFAWARLDLPGTNDLYVVSVHLKAGSGGSDESRRAAEAVELKDLITTNFPANAWIIVAGDMNLFSDTEAAIVTFKTFLSDEPVPADQNGDVDTNSSRAERYDRVLPSFAMTNLLIPLVMPSRTYTNGLVFDSRVYTPLSEVAPVQTNDSGVLNMQHMAVTKVLNVPYLVTNTPSTPGDRFWTNPAGGNYHVASNWLSNLVAGAQDNAHFTNNASYQVSWTADASVSNAFFNARSGTITQAVGGFAWLVTNRYIVGRDSGATAAVTHVSGSLRVTNSAGSARLVIGELGRGTFTLDGGNVTTDFLLSTNNGVPFGNYPFNFNSGSLTTLHGSTISQPIEVFVGNSAAPAVWTMSGGTNRIENGNSQFTRIGNTPAARGIVTVTGSGTVWSNSGTLLVGYFGSSNQVFLREGGKMTSANGYIGFNAGANANEVWITGGGSLWTCVDLGVGFGGSNCRLVVTNGGRMSDFYAGVGTGVSSSNNSVLVTGSGSVWDTQAELYVGNEGSGNSLVITNNGLVTAALLASIGTFANASNNILTVTGGSLVVTNGSADGLLQVGGEGRGTLVLNSGTVQADTLVVTNGAKSVFSFNGGTLQSRATAVTNGSIFALGDGVSPATFELLGAGTHVFNNGLIVHSNGVLKGNGTVLGVVTVVSGGVLAPGVSPGRIALSNSPSLQGTIVMEISRNGAVLTNDQIQVAGTLTYGGSLVVSSLGPTALAVGDRFALFSASSYVGTFPVLSLPSLPAGFTWMNKLLVDGSIEVISVPQPKFTSISVSGTNVIITGTNGTAGANYVVQTATNLTPSLSNWQSIATNPFDSGGNFSFTNTVLPGEPQRFFRLRTP